MPTIEIEISQEGASQVRTQGFAGNTCRSASRFLEHALGEVRHEKLTSEFHLTDASLTSSQAEQL